ncbi:MAG: heavy metal translocating P-type ATPase metal-binding domain-containing protein, partial [Pseudomonadota bacterium]|nr:heavy metal translocating P-type ATPase metal-binding domain-containing protein [Pseudomonadota bacterium]
MSKTHCYHCGLPVPDHLQLSVTIQGQPQPMCCPGCQAVAQTIIDAGLSDFYSYRTEHAPTGQVLVPEFLEHITVYDNPTVQKQFVRCADEHIREATLILEGITCAACVWLNERHLKSLPGVFEVRINYSTHRAHIRWDDSQIRLSDILKAISQIGYLAHPYDPARQQALLDAERKQHLRRLGIAGVLGMQVMMFSVALYAGDWYGIEKEFKLLFYWINLILTLPILLYCAQPFFSSAWRDLRLGQAGMDVPVSLGITLAFVGSVWTTLQLSHSPALAHQAHVYYDSIAMFVFFLLTARYFELLARQRSIQAAEHLIHLVPTTATRLVNTVHFESVLVAELNIGDEILVRPGEAIPIDGRIRVGHSSINESLLTGEHYPLSKGPGEQVIAGSINIDNPLHIQ